MKIVRKPNVVQMPTPVAPLPVVDTSKEKLEVMSTALTNATHALSTVNAQQHESSNQLVALVKAIAARNNRVVEVEIIRDEKSKLMSRLVITSKGATS